MISNVVYYIIGGYFVLAGILGVGMYLIWMTMRFQIRVYNLEELYGRTGARIICLILGLLLIAFGYLSNSIFGQIL